MPVEILKMWTVVIVNHVVRNWSDSEWKDRPWNYRWFVIRRCMEAIVKAVEDQVAECDRDYRADVAEMGEEGAREVYSIGHNGVEMEIG